jgi:hypothetical protein
MLFVGAERQRCETDHPPPRTAVIKKEGNGNSTPLYPKSKHKLKVNSDNVTSGFMIEKQRPVET